MQGPSDEPAARPPVPVEPAADADFRQLIESVGDYAIFLLDREGHVRTWNRGARRIKGYEPHEIIGRHFSIFYTAEDLARGWPNHELKVAIQTGRFEDEGWRRRKDGSQFWANIIITRLTDAQGRHSGFAKITRDLTERRQQEELLRQSEERFRMLVESVQDYAIFMLDPDGHIVSWNAGAHKAKGYEASEIIGRHFSVFYPADVAASGWPQEELRRALDVGRFEDEGWRLRKDGTRFWASVVITALFDHGGRHRGFAKITRDLTDRRRIRALEDEGRRITTFLALLGHELRNPLAPIANAVSMMEMIELPTEELRTARAIIGRQLKHTTRLVDDLLDVGRITSGKVHLDLQPVALGAVALQAMESVEPLVQRKQHSLRLHAPDAELWVRGDRARLVQVISNLLNNAAKFTPPGGNIALTLRRNGALAEISVTDNGPGVQPAMLTDIFNLFVQGSQDTARSQGGLGLGLSLVQQLVTLHGGDVAAFSTGKAGEGAEFLVRLPITTSLARHDEPLPTLALGPQRRVLVVDDNRDAADTLSMLLRGMGYIADAVYDGGEALRRIRGESLDVVLLDIGLPGLNGLEVAQMVRRELASPPQLIAITGYGQERDRQASREAGFHAHLTKPLDIGTLAVLLRAEPD